MSWSVQKNHAHVQIPKPFFVAQSFAQGATHGTAWVESPVREAMRQDDTRTEYIVMCHRNGVIFKRHIRLSLPWVLLLEIVALAPKPEHVELENHQAEDLGSIES